MSQRRYGQAQFPEDGDSGRPGGADQPSDGRDAAPRSFGAKTRETTAPWDYAGDSFELDRDGEDRSRRASTPRSASNHLRSDNSGVAAPDSRWSSPSRRRRREQPQPTNSYEEEAFDAGRYPAGVDDPPFAPWPSDLDLAESRADARGSGYRDPDEYDEGDLDYPRPAARSRSRRPARPRPTIVMPRVQMPRSVAGSDIVRDPVALALLGAGVILALVSALVTFSRVRRLPDAIELRYDAYGLPARWGPPESLWQLPLLTAMVTIISLVIAVAVSRHDRFASRFLLATALVVGLLSWVPLIRFLW